MIRTHLAALHEIVQCLHGLLDGRGLIEAVDLEQVDVARLEPAQRRVDGIEDRGARETVLVDVVTGASELGRHARPGRLADGEEALGQDNDLLARDIVLQDV